MDLGERSGNRAVGIGEVPYFDPQSQSRAEALGLVKSESPPMTSSSNGVNSHGHDHGVHHGGHGHQGKMAHAGHGMLAHGDHVMSTA